MLWQVFASPAYHPVPAAVQSAEQPQRFHVGAMLVRKNRENVHMESVPRHRARKREYDDSVECLPGRKRPDEPSECHHVAAGQANKGGDHVPPPPPPPGEGIPEHPPKVRG